jgi:5'(3')-deoxyribonucleotidase
MSRRKSIALDMDEVIANVAPKFLDIYEETYGKRLAVKDYWGNTFSSAHDGSWVY